MTGSVIEWLRDRLGGHWRYDRRARRWIEMTSRPLADGTRTRRYVVREAQGLVIYDSAQPELPGRAVR